MALQAKNGGVLGYVGNGLERAIVEYLHQISEVPEEIRGLVTKVNRIVAVMKDAEQTPSSSHEVRLWLQEAKQVLLDAEDLFDELATDAAVQKMRADTQFIIRFMLLFPAIPTRTRAMRLWIQGVNDMLDLLTSRTPMFAHQISTVPDRCHGLKEWRETSSLLPDDASVIGRDIEKDQIIQILLSSDDQLVAESSSNNNCFSVLSIVGLGGVGKTTLELSEQHWMTVLKSWKLQQGENDILPALLLSYQYLRADLKQCFAYCSLFSKDRRFSKEEVVQLWEAQSFIREDRGERLETMGSKYFDELLHMSFFEPPPRPSDENLYVMHDLIHDLAEYVSKDDCFRLEDQNIVNIPDTVHHMSVYVSERGQIDIINKLCFHEKLRTLLFQTSCHLNTRDLNQLFLKLKMLRVLGLSECGITKLPDSIGDLKHLRYIDLQWNRGLTRLPESLGNLYNLQVLNLIGCHSLRVLPSKMSQLVNLRHLQTHDCDLVSSVDGLGKLTGLQELAVSGRKVRELGGMCMLRELKVINLEEVGSKEEASQARLHTMEHLQVLRLAWSWIRDITSTELKEEVLQGMQPSDGIKELYIDRYRGIRLPDWMEASNMTSFSSLRRVSLSNCPNWQVPCSFLSQQRHLEYLEINRMSEWEGYWSCHVSWDCLLELTIIHCPKLKELPTLPRTLRRLKLHEVGIYCLPELDGCSCAEGGIETSTSSHHLTRTSASLSRLDIFSCHKLTSVSRLLQQQLSDLEVIEIVQCKNLMSLPEKGFGHLVSLKRLKISECYKLTCLLQDEVGSSQHLPCSLEQLEINCGDVMGGWWWAGLQRLTSIAILSLCGCPTTVELLFDRLERHHHPHLPVTLKQLEIVIGYRVFGYHCTSSSQLSPPITHAGASAGAIRAFTSLEKLTIQYSPNFLNKWGGSGLPSSLERLTIVDGNDGDQECLSTYLPDLISLKELTLENLENLRSLPNLSGLTSLETLRILFCRSIQSWPTNGLPSSLQTLRIAGCPALTWEHKHKPKSMWPEVVAHIPKVIIDKHPLR